MSGGHTAIDCDQRLKHSAHLDAPSHARNQMLVCSEWKWTTVALFAVSGWRSSVSHVTQGVQDFDVTYEAQSSNEAYGTRRYYVSMRTVAALDAYQ
jgi:hypothetical protein